MKKKRNRLTTTKKLIWLITVWGLLCTTFSYVLALLGRDPVASLSEVIVGGTVLTVLGYLLKSLFEKRKDFGSVGQDDDIL